MPNLRYLYELIRYCASKHPALLLGAGLGLLSVLIELVALTSLLPLTTLASGRALDVEN